MTGVLQTPEQLCEVLGLPFSEQQLAAITAPLEPGVIIAGAGSGKTTVMAARVVWLVGSGQLAPEQVLGLTFTRKAAAELSARVRTALQRAGVIDDTGVDEAGEQLVLTYDAFAARLVAEHGLRIGVESDPVMITGASRYRLAARVVTNAAGPFEHLASFAPVTLTERLLKLDSDLTSHLVSAAEVGAHAREFRTALAEAPLNRYRREYASVRQARAITEQRLELLGLTTAYAELKRSLGYVEFADQMAVAAELARRVPAVSEAPTRAVQPSGVSDTVQAPSPSSVVIAISAGSGRRGPYLGRGANPSSNSSMPSLASAGENHNSSGRGARPSLAAIASTAWMVVSWHCRRVQACRGGGASNRKNCTSRSSGAAAKALSRSTRPSSSHSSRSTDAAASASTSASGRGATPRTFAVAQR